MPRLIALALLALCACSPPQPPTTPVVSAPIAHGQVISPTLAVGGQPDAGALALMARSGLELVVNLRTGREMDFDEASAVKDLGMRYISIPVAGALGLTDEAVRTLDEALDDTVATLVHCKSGNRVGALFALRAQRHQGKSVEDAMAVGLAHGLTGLKGAVLERLNAAATPDFAAEAAKRVGLFKAALGAELKAAMKAGGPVNAIGVCAKVAPEITAKLSDETLGLRRVGTRARNAKTNVPTEAMSAVLDGLSRQSPVHVGLVDGKTTAVHGLFIENPVCLSCHGPVGALDQAVKAALAQHYPDDKATGYQMGDLRGAIVVEQRK